jgi:hypothetical protein
MGEPSVTDFAGAVDMDGKRRARTPNLALFSGQPEGKRVISQKQLINRLNHLNFRDDTILVNLVHTKYATPLSLEARPLPCLDGSLDSLWLETPGLEHKLSTHTYINFIVPDPLEPLLVEAALVGLTSRKISFRLPDTCKSICSRGIQRHRCRDIEVSLFQNGTLFAGELIEFSPAAFRVEIRGSRHQSLQWVNSQCPVHIVFNKDGELLFSGECEIIRKNGGQRAVSLVIRPLASHIRRFKSREFRSLRQKLVPSPNVIFPDPLTGKNVNLKVIDISGSGFSVEETEENSVLFAGRIIPELKIDLAGFASISCRAQVVYRNHNTGEADAAPVKCGLAILDMEIQSHMRLLSLVNQAGDGNSYICNNLDQDTLWELFFETGFLYPKKYAFLQANKKGLKQIYEKLYTEHPDIARHFVYQKNGVVYGHIAMLRFYENTWLIHHHAGKKENASAGIQVLEQLSRSIIDTCNLLSAHMTFLICYYREENRFPSKVFGAFAEELKEPKGCSLDSFAYLHFEKTAAIRWEMAGPWALTKTGQDDLAELELFYESESGGLMLRAMDLSSDISGEDSLAEEFARIGLTKERHLFSVRKDGILKGIVAVDISDSGLNMSDLTNSIKMFILDSEAITVNVFNMIISLISSKFRQNEIPVLVFPHTYADRHGIRYEKKYTLFVIDTQYSDQYFKSLSWTRRLARSHK